jgi:hypothetical protein
MENSNSWKDGAVIWTWVKALSVLILVGVASYKVYITPFNVTLDFPTLLSLLLALFSVALSSLFFFKATETSNTFYDNTYKFTKDIAQLLVRIESGFGEKLRHLDESYNYMRDHFQNVQQPKTTESRKEAEKSIEDEKKEIQKIREERDKAINLLIESSKLQENEKEEVKVTLKQKEADLLKAQKDLERMNQRLAIEKTQNHRLNKSPFQSQFEMFTIDTVINEIGIDRVNQSSSGTLKKLFDRASRRLPEAYLKDLENMGYYRNGLTKEGINFLRYLSEKIPS